MKDSSIFYKYDLSNEVHFIKCIKQIEFMVRKSLSYDSWQKRTKYAVHKCPLCGDSFEFVRPESHHYPLTLFDITEGVLQKYIDLNTIHDYTDYDICQEVMNAHFQKKVEYVVLCEFCHKKYHSGVPEILESIEAAHMSQKKTIQDFYTKDLSKIEKD